MTLGIYFRNKNFHKFGVDTKVFAFSVRVYQFFLPETQNELMIEAQIGEGKHRKNLSIIWP